jgi:hypothetical protein
LVYGWQLIADPHGVRQSAGNNPDELFGFPFSFWSWFHGILLDGRALVWRVPSAAKVRLRGDEPDCRM